MGKASADGLIIEYLAAYRAANPGNEAPKITYERGWFVFRDPYPIRYRRWAVEEMRDRLRLRVSGSPPKGEDAQGAAEGEAGQSGGEAATPQNRQREGRSE